MPDALHAPVDADAADRLAERGLRMVLVDRTDDVALRHWREAVARGFLDPVNTDAEHAEVVADFHERRAIGIYDDGTAEPASPIATIDAWPVPVSLPGGDVPAWAISAVTVAPTHRRRGIARAMLGAELRTAAAAGLPLAVITVSEATIYSRYGFGPATSVADLRVDSRRIRWTGPDAPGRLHLVSRERMLADAPAIFERARLRSPGGVGLSGLLLTRLFGRLSDDAAMRAHRFVRYDDEAGVAQGYLSYTAIEAEDDSSESRVDVHHLAAATDDAYAALWRFLLELDLIGEVRAPLRSTDEPLRWQVDDQRAIRTAAVNDHLWIRVLDPVAALSGRTYAGPGRAVLDVADEDGFAAGRFLLEVDASGSSSVSRDATSADDVPEIALDAAALGSLLPGGVRAATLAAAGRIRGRRPGDAVAVDRLMASPVTPWLSVWF
jgi:predicted acetyltransferase